MNKQRAQINDGATWNVALAQRQVHLLQDFEVVGSNLAKVNQGKNDWIAS